MRKAHMQVVIDGLKKRIADVERERDEARGALHTGLTRLHTKADDHVKALGKIRSDISGLAEAVRAATPPPAAPAAPAEAPEPEAKPVTPITARRGTKATG